MIVECSYCSNLFQSPPSTMYGFTCESCHQSNVYCALCHQHQILTGNKSNFPIYCKKCNRDKKIKDILGQGFSLWGNPQFTISKLNQQLELFNLCVETTESEVSKNVDNQIWFRIIKK